MSKSKNAKVIQGNFIPCPSTPRFIPLSNGVYFLNPVSGRTTRLRTEDVLAHLAEHKLETPSLLAELAELGIFPAEAA